MPDFRFTKTTVDENTVLFNNVQNLLIQSKIFVQNP